MRACAQVFTTVHDGQTEMDVLILEGDFSQASQCNVLGQLTFAGMAPAAKGGWAAAAQQGANARGRGGGVH